MRLALSLHSATLPLRAQLIPSATSMPQLTAALAFALSNLCAVRLSNTGAAFLLCVPLALLLFYGAAGFNDMSEDDLIEARWLRRPIEARPLTEFWTTRRLSQVHWGAVLPPFHVGICYSFVCLCACVLQLLDCTRSA